MPRRATHLSNLETDLTHETRSWGLLTCKDTLHRHNNIISQVMAMPTGVELLKLLSKSLKRLPSCNRKPNLYIYL